MRSMLRNACVIHMSVVTQTSTTRNAPRVVRKILRPIDPIRVRRPRSRLGWAAAPGPPLPVMAPPSPVAPLEGYLDRPTKWPRQGKVFEYSEQKLAAEGPKTAGLVNALSRRRNRRG